MMARRDTQRDSTALRRAAGRRRAPAIAVMAALWGLVLGPAQAQQFLTCGAPVTHHLAPGETDTYRLVASGLVGTIVDVIDTSGSIGLLQLNVAGQPPTCNGSQLWNSGAVAVSDCIGNDQGDYTIEFNVVQDSIENCGVPLSCGVAPANTALNVPGEVDAYTFVGVAGQQVSLTATATSDTTGSLRMRLFSPDGYLQIDSCSGSLTYDVPSNGTYTVLVSACITPSTGPYTIVWQRLPACAAAAAPAFGYVLYTASRTVGVVNLDTNQTIATLPGPPSPVQGDDFLPSEGSITVSPNSGLAYVTLEESATISIINTTLNRPVGSIYLPEAVDLRLALDPEGRYAYATSPYTLGGIAVINTATRKIEAVIPVESYDPAILSGTAVPIAVSPDGKSVYVGKGSEERGCVGGSAPGSACGGDMDCPGLGVCGVIGELIVIDTASRTVAGRITDQRLGDVLLDISFNPTGTLAYAATYSALSVIDTASGSVTQSLPLGASGIAYSRDGRVGYAVGCAVGAGGSCVDPYAAVLVIDMNSLTITNTISLTSVAAGNPTGGVALSPDGGRLLVAIQGASTGAPAAAVVDTATLQVVGTIQAAGDNSYTAAIVTPPTGLCTADASGQSRVTVGELVTSVNYAADGCPNARPRGSTAQ